VRTLPELKRIAIQHYPLDNGKTSEVALPAPQGAGARGTHAQSVLASAPRAATNLCVERARRIRNIVLSRCSRQVQCTILIIPCAGLQCGELMRRSDLADFVATKSFHLQSGNIWQL